MLNKSFSLVLLLLLLSFPLCAQKEKMFEDFKALVKQGQWFKAAEMIEVLEIYYRGNTQFQALKEEVIKKIAFMPFTRKLVSKYKGTTFGLIFVGILSLIFYSVALRKGN